MKTVGERKKAQGYTKNPTLKQCQNCGNYQYETKKHLGGYLEHVKLRCNIGGFKVNKTASCDNWRGKP